MTDNLAIQLMVMSGPEDGKVISLTAPKNGESYLIGRLPNANLDIVINYDNQVSRQHARLFAKDNVWYLQDAGSKNGTHMGKQKLTSIVQLDAGQMFRVGRTWLRLESAPTAGGDEEG